jgi:putative acetyltransferase
MHSVFMEYKIEPVDKSDYPDIVEVWEASVRVTHHFLREEDIVYFKPLILNTYLDAVELRCVKVDDNRIVGFLGVAGENLEMLFLHPDYRGKGIGATLLRYAIHQQRITKVDVNEQNEQAVGFYEHAGFTTIARSELDGTGKPYPILHMALVG